MVECSKLGRSGKTLLQNTIILLFFFVQLSIQMLLIFLLVPEASTQKHLEILSEIAELLSDAGLRQGCGEREEEE